MAFSIPIYLLHFILPSTEGFEPRRNHIIAEVHPAGLIGGHGLGGIELHGQCRPVKGNGPPFVVDRLYAVSCEESHLVGHMLHEVPGHFRHAEGIFFPADPVQQAQDSIPFCPVFIRGACDLRIPVEGFLDIVLVLLCHCYVETFVKPQFFLFCHLCRA